MQGLGSFYERLYMKYGRDRLAKSISPHVRSKGLCGNTDNKTLITSSSDDPFKMKPSTDRFKGEIKREKEQG